MKGSKVRKVVSVVALSAGVAGTTLWLLRRGPSVQDGRSSLSRPLLKEEAGHGVAARFAEGQDAPTEVEEAAFTPEQLEQYYKVYESPYVKYLRKVFDGYLTGTSGGGYEYEALRRFDNDYYKSRFVVLSVEDALMGGSLITLIFQDRPDKVFKAWVYENDRKAHELREFAPGDFDEGEVEEIRVRFAEFLRDKTHAM